ncbi:MAG: hypothetical protein Q9Q40_09885, partial [Acidobacteriota bacterium]|nr:hypothetical protein [Acidobacteriota bacterium]
DPIPHRKRELHGYKVMVWAAVGINFRRIVRIPRCTTTGAAAINTNEATYVNIICEHAKYHPA